MIIYIDNLFHAAIYKFFRVSTCITVVKWLIDRLYKLQ